MIRLPTGPEVYFAYGSNMLLERLRRRCPSARKLDLGRARGYQLRFDKRSWADGSGKCRLAPAEGESAWGVLYRMPGDERAALDRAEGLGKGYERSILRVEPVGGGAAAAYFYEADPDFVDPSLLPFEWYRDLVAAGARQHGLPGPYVERIREHPARPDPDGDRAKKNRDLLRRVERVEPKQEETDDEHPAVEPPTGDDHPDRQDLPGKDRDRPR